MRHFNSLPMWMLMVSLLSFAGCSGNRGGDETPSQQETERFKQAIQGYLNENSMDMKVDNFKEITIQGDSATADVSLLHADEITGIHVQWTFHFRKRNGEWHVVKHEKS